MTTSAVFTKSVAQMGEEALRDARIIPAEQKVKAVDYGRVRDAINNIVTYWQAEDFNLWQRREAVLPLNVGQSRYLLGPDGAECFNADELVTTTLTVAGVALDTVLTIGSSTDILIGSRVGVQLADNTRHWAAVTAVNSGVEIEIGVGLASAALVGATILAYTNKIPRPLRVPSIRYASTLTASEIPVSKWSREEYFEQPDKLSSGTVNQQYYSPTLTNGELYVWQVAGNVNNLLRFTYTEPALVYSANTDLLDFPSEFYIPLKWAIAAEIGPSYGIPDNRQSTLEVKAATSLEKALGHDNEMASMYIQPDFSA